MKDPNIINISPVALEVQRRFTAESDMNRQMIAVMSGLLTGIAGFLIVNPEYVSTIVKLISK